MFRLILLIILALFFGYFATQNTVSVPITFASLHIAHLPLYIILGITLLIGLSFSWLISLLTTLTVAMKLRGKENTIKDVKKTNYELTRKINELEIENAKLKGELKKEYIDNASL